MKVRLRQVPEAASGVLRFKAEVCTAMEVLGCESGKRTARKVAGNVLEAASARNSLEILAAGFL